MLHRTRRIAANGKASSTPFVGYGCASLHGEMYGIFAIPHESEASWLRCYFVMEKVHLHVLSICVNLGDTCYLYMLLLPIYFVAGNGICMDILNKMELEVEGFRLVQDRGCYCAHSSAQLSN